MSGARRDDSCQVAIVGAGPVGLWLALALMQRGLDVRVLERRASPRPWSRAIGVHPPSLACLAEVGALTALRAAGVQIDRARVFAGSALIGEASFGGLSCPEPYILSVPQSTTETTLEDILRGRAPAALSRSCTAQHIEATSDAVRIDYSHGDGPRTLRAQVLVGCDGKDSLVRGAIGGEFRGGPRGDGFLMGDAPSLHGLGTRAFVSLSPHGVVESFPLPGGRRRWVARVGDRRPEPSAPALADAIVSRTGQRITADAFEVVSGFEAERYDVTRWQRGRMVLCGDAAHVLSPLGGQGMNLGLLDAQSLAATLGAYFSGSIALRVGLERYERARRRAARAAQLRAAAYLNIARPGAVRHALTTRLVQKLLAPGLHDYAAGVFTMVRT